MKAKSLSALSVVRPIAYRLDWCAPYLYSWNGSISNRVYCPRHRGPVSRLRVASNTQWTPFFASASVYSSTEHGAPHCHPPPVLALFDSLSSTNGEYMAISRLFLSIAPFCSIGILIPELNYFFRSLTAISRLHSCQFVIIPAPFFFHLDFSPITFDSSAVQYIFYTLNF